MKTLLHNLVFFGIKVSKNSPQTARQKNENFKQSNIDSFKIGATLVVLFSLFSINNASAQKTWDGGGSNDNWSTASNWNNNTLPVTGDNIVIPNGSTVLADVTITVASLTVGGGASGSLTMSGNTDRTLTVSGNVIVNSGATITASGNGGHILNIGGNLTNAGTFNDGSGDMSVVFNGGSQTISGAGSFDYINFLFSAAGTKSINSSLFVSGSWTNNGGTVGGTGTITLDGSSQTVTGSSSTMNFPNLVLSGGTKTFSKALIVSGNLSIASGALANFGSLTTNTAGTLTLAGIGTAAANFGSTSTTATAPVYKNNTYFTSGTTGYITVGTSGCTAPTITLGTISNICVGATSFSIPYTAISGGANLYSISGTGITTVTNGTLNAAPSSITVNLSPAASAGTISSSGFTVSSSVTGCISSNVSASVTVNPTVEVPTFTTAPTSLCQDAPDSTFVASATNSTGITYSVSPSGAGTIGSTSGVMNWSSSFSGNATITASAAGCGGPKTVNAVVVITPSVATPSFSAGDTSVCQDSANETYTATAANNTGITYSLSPVGAGTINTSTGEVDWNSSFSGTATITASATGCNGPKTANRNVTVTATVGTPTFSLGPAAVCQNASTSTYIASASDSTSITYSVSPAAAGTMTNFGWGFMDWSSTFSGTAIITATAAGCNGPKTVTRTVIVTPTVGTPVFTAGADTVCQNAANELYTATASDATAISYSVSPSGAGTIGSSTGVMDWNASFTGNATITASATGCNGPKTANKVVVVTASVTTPVFSAGATSICQDAANTTYTATASNTTGITYSISPAGAGTIGALTGIVDWNAGFTGNATITASAAGCNGPLTAQRVVAVQVLPNAGTDGALTICAGSTVTLAQLNAAITGEQAGGSWSPALAGAGTYTYTVNATSPCTSPDTSQVIVSEQAQPNAGTDGAVIICAGSIVTLAQLDAAITGEDAGGSWSPALAGAGTYTYTVAATSPCVAPDVSQVVVTEQAGPNAGTDGVYTICSGTDITLAQLQAAITGEDAGGTWSPALAGAGTYTYTVAATSPCTVADTSIVIVSAVSCQPAELSNCGNTPVLTSVNARIFVANTVTQATKYRYRVALSTAPSTYFYCETNYPSFRLTDVVGLTPAYGTTYNVEIQNEFLLSGNTVASAYGTLCTVATQPANDISIAVNQCGQTLAAVNSKIYVNGITGATMYTYRIAKQSAPTTYAYIETPYSNFRLTYPQTSGSIAIEHNTMYIVAVSVTTPSGVSDFNSPCLVTTPVGPTTTLRQSQCGDDDNPYIIATSSTKVHAGNHIPGATYTFKLEQYSGNVLVDTNEATSPINYFNTNMFTGDNALLPDTNYHVYVRINYYGEGDYDHDCVVRTPVALKNDEITQQFKALAYPNPFANNFMIDVKSASESAVNLKVYDMIGRLIDQREVRMSDLETTTIGDNYPSGVYNVVVSQENSNQTVRVVKR